LILAVSLAFESIYKNYLENNWKVLESSYENDFAYKIQSQFSKYQSATSDAIAQIAQSPEMRELLSGDNNTSRSVFFEYLLSNSIPEITEELYDRNKQILSWAGNRGIITDTSFLTTKVNSVIIDGAIYSYYLISVPVQQNDTIVGYLVGKRFFDVNYPINNRFINNSVFSSTFTAGLDEMRVLNYSSDSSHQSNNDLVSIPLLNFTGGRLGFVFFTKPTLTEKIDVLHDRCTAVNRFILLCIICMVAYKFINLSGRTAKIFLKLIYYTFALWFLRYSLIWLDIPQSIMHISLFDANDFASRFGYGIARSLADLFLSSVFLIVNIYFIASHTYLKRDWASYFSSHKIKNRFILILGVVLFTILLLLLIRGYAAAIHSAVFDSAISYNEPTIVLPPLKIWMMLLSLIFLTGSLVIAVTCFILLIYDIISSQLLSKRNSLTAWITVIAILIIGSILFGISQKNPLLAQGQRAFLILLFTGTSLAVWCDREKILHNVRGNRLLILVVVSVILLVPLLDKTTRNLEHNQIELIANEISIPVDSWLTFLTNTALDELSDQKIRQVLLSADEYEISKLAFSGWANSLLSKEGNNCSVIYFDKNGKTLSEFNIGVPAEKLRGNNAGNLPTQRSVFTEEKPSNGVMIKWYTGYTPLLDGSGSVIGSVLVVVTGGRKTILRSDTPEILRTSISGKNELHYRALIYSEYIDGRLNNTNREDVPKDKLLPHWINEKYLTGNGMWCTDTIEGKLYDTYFFKEQKSPLDGSWFALGIESSNTKEYIYSYLRYLLLYSFISLVIVLLIWSIRSFSGLHYRMSFRGKLLVAFIAISLIPLVFIAFYNRHFVQERAMEATVKYLSEQSAIITSEVQKRYQVNAPVALEGLSDDQCMMIASDLNTDFNVYSLSSIRATSKPEMFDAELLDPFLSAAASLNIIWRGKEYFYETQMIGNYSYVVGYRPLIAENGIIMGVVSVPAIYKQKDIDQEIARSNIYLYMAYALSLGLSVLIGLILASRISSPIRRLREATKRIAKGDLDIKFRETGEDELGELENSFGRMTHDLKHAQDQMLQAQREIAWKEMAKQVAHEIKNPLTPMKLSIQHLQQAYKDRIKDFENVFHQVTTTILEQIDVLSHIASEFSHFARMPQRKLEEVDVHTVLREAVSLFNKYGELEFDLKMNATYSIIHADKEELRRALINIIRNSIDAMNEKGVISISTQSDGKRLGISIEDRGPGMTDESVKRLFEPNFSTKTSGMGLGLTIVKKTIDELGGTITFSSAIGKGTTATIFLPLK
jgi:signal transduction histidine kinase